jgi:hypothetical protein
VTLFPDCAPILLFGNTHHQPIFLHRNMIQLFRNRPIYRKAACAMLLVCLQLRVEVARESDNFLSTSAPCLPRQPSRLALLHPCLPAAMRYENPTSTKTHLARYRTLHRPSHPTLASGLACRKFGSIDGPSSSYLSLLEPLSQSPESITTWLLHDAKRCRHVQTLNRWVLPWRLCLTTCRKA